MFLKIYKPSKTAMQSGKAKTKSWIAEYVSDKSLTKDSLMGWNSSSDTKSQIKIYFSSKDDAILWARKNKYRFELIESQEKKITPKKYSDNFSFYKKEPWTH
tara:strand:- start:9169 stop:9474 length:306 start_codon:yes stop_codon:yes gene_type:complete